MTPTSRALFRANNRRRNTPTCASVVLFKAPVARRHDVICEIAEGPIAVFSALFGVFSWIAHVLSTQTDHSNPTTNTITTAASPPTAVSGHRHHNVTTNSDGTTHQQRCTRSRRSTSILRRDISSAALTAFLVTDAPRRSCSVFKNRTSCDPLAAPAVWKSTHGCQRRRTMTDMLTATRAPPGQTLPQQVAC